MDGSHFHRSVLLEQVWKEYGVGHKWFDDIDVCANCMANVVALMHNHSSEVLLPVDEGKRLQWYELVPNLNGILRLSCFPPQSFSHLHLHLIRDGRDFGGHNPGLIGFRWKAVRILHLLNLSAKALVL